MPNPNMLYAVTAVVVALLTVWIVLVFKNVKEPWAKPGLPVKDSIPSKYSTITDEPPAQGDGENASASPSSSAPKEPKDGEEKSGEG